MSLSKVCTVAFLIVAVGCVSAANPRVEIPRIAAAEFGCTAEEITLTPVSTGHIDRYSADGCGKRQLYSCGGGTCAASGMVQTH